jgi:hypothetical protein
LEYWLRVPRTLKMRRGVYSLRRYPIVAYLVDGQPCVVRIRNTDIDVVWQMDFCKLTYYGRSNAGHSWYYWQGEGSVLCKSSQPVKENYTDPDFAKISGVCDNTQNQGIDITYFVGGYPVVARLTA